MASSAESFKNEKMDSSVSCAWRRNFSTSTLSTLPAATSTPKPQFRKRPKPPTPAKKEKRCYNNQALSKQVRRIWPRVINNIQHLPSYSPHPCVRFSPSRRPPYPQQYQNPYPNYPYPRSVNYYPRSSSNSQYSHAPKYAYPRWYSFRRQHSRQPFYFKHPDDHEPRRIRRRNPNWI